MIRKPMPRWARVAAGMISAGIVVALYGGLAYRQHQINPNDKTIPSLDQFVDGVVKICQPHDPDNFHLSDAWNSGQTPRPLVWKRVAFGLWRGFWSIWLFEDALASLTRLAMGMLIGVLLAFVVGIGMGCFTSAEAFLLPPVAFLARIPPTAMLAVYFALLGINFKLYVAMVALGIFPTLAQAIHQAAKKDVTEHAIFKAYTLGASQLEVIFHVVIRQILPRIIENVRLQLGPAMVFLIAAEFALADTGFGYRLRMQARLTNMNVIYLYLIILGMGGFLVDWMLARTRRWLCPWFGE